MVDEGLTLKKLLSILKRRIVTILLVSLAISSLTLLSVFYFVKPSYEANEYIFIGNLQNDSEDYYEENQKINRMVASSIDFITSPMVINDVIDKYDIKRFNLKDNLVVTNTKESQIIKITVIGDDPELVEDITRSIAKTSVSKMGSLLKLNEVQVLSENSTLVTNSNQLLGGVIGCTIGLFLGIGAAIVRESFDETIKEVMQIEMDHGLTVIGQVDMKKKRFSLFSKKGRQLSRTYEWRQNDALKKNGKDKSLQAIK
ncbi:Wzz/FepE/Etk N-terminal domain-containing protein [Alkalihalobacillus macyae]|uniref:YveK family protein n=1 Tax=Guptibacillus hwajinpoensis TaxID=208199 RepID=UPI00273BCF30|nr:Wzz/FepE/Etk N-terminal domain-containing protein [Alkalihalobacillus macyae]MDP4552610.1 Wzz/FepE/Etk N-terminal domain-containing protein [Alkalihalobacillus macyae]